MTIGDILAVIALLVATGAAWGATILLTLTLFPERVERAQDALLTKPAHCFWRGAGASLVLGVLGVAAMNLPGPGRLFSIILLGGLAAAAAVGSGGIVRTMSDRIGKEGTDLTPFARLTRATALYVCAGFLPLVGWLAIVPAALLLAVGSALRPRRRAVQYTAPAMPGSYTQPISGADAQIWPSANATPEAHS